MNEIMDIPFPCAGINRNMDIIWTNQLFKDEFSVTELSGVKFTDIVPNIDMGAEVQLIAVNNNAYNVYISRRGDICSLYFVKCQCRNYETMVGLLVLDNYTEVQESIEETRHPHLLAVIDRKINDYFYALDGIVRKFEKDKYLLILSREKLDAMRSDKFSIMEALEKIDMGNTPVSMSLGLGLNGETLTQSMEFARGAMDLALGRGGNQVVIKDGEDKYHFIGGSGKENTNNSGVRARTKIYALIELILSATNVIIMGHKNPDLDSLGSSAGIFAIANFFGKPSYIVLNEVTQAVAPLYNRLIEDKRYKDVFIKNEEALKLVRRKSVVIVTDTHKKKLCECEGLLDTKARIVVIDHHRKSPDAIENYALTYHESFASSASELVSEMLIYANKAIKLTKAEAEGLLAGITVDTKNFAFKTGRMTFEAAAYLKKSGADTIAVRRLFQNPMENYVAKTEVVKNAKIVHENMAISVLETKVYEPRILIAQAADELLGITGIEASFVLYADSGCVYISARSLGNINVQIIMENLGGGGHQTGSACQIENTDINRGMIMLNNAIDEYLKEER